VLREQARAKEADRREQSPDYSNMSGSIEPRDIDGCTALAWRASYKRDGQAWTEYMIRGLGRKSLVFISLNVPTAQFDALKPAADQLATSVKLK